MKFTSAIAVAALASVGAAQLENIPKCALTCFLGPLGSDGCQPLDNFECHCQKAESLFAAVIPCVQEACEAADQQAAIDATVTTCSAAGVEVEIPAEASPVASSSEAAATSTEVVSSTAVETATEVETSTAVETSTEVEASTSVAETTVSAIPTPSGNGTGAVPSPTVSEFPGSAGKVTLGLGAVVAALFAL